MSFDLSQFDKAPTFAPDNQIAIVLSLNLSDVTEDITQPRSEFDEDELARLAEDIARRGVQAPIAVRPEANGKYQIIHGARRYRASCLAGAQSIPAIVQADAIAFDEYSQVLENTQRENLSAMDIARFIQKRKEKGESNSEIARQLSEKPEWVTYHLALINMPSEVMTAYEDGRLKGAKTVYELRKLQSKKPEIVEELVASGFEITRSRIAEKAKSIKAESSVSSSPLEKNTEHSSSVLENPVETNSPTLIKLKQPTVQSPVPLEADDGNVNFIPEVEILKRPAVIGIYQGEPVQVLISLKPSEPGYAWILGNQSIGQLEVLADQITLNRIEEKQL